MADEKNKPKGINKAKKERRFIDITLNVQKINKDLLIQGEKGVYLKCKLIMLPDGEVDNNEQLGFIAQVVPADIWKKDKSIKGEILGNAKENEWSGGIDSDVDNGKTGVTKEAADDLPF